MGVPLSSWVFLSQPLCSAKRLSRPIIEQAPRGAIDASTEDKTVNPSAFPRHLEQAVTIDIFNSCSQRGTGHPWPGQRHWRPVSPSSTPAQPPSDWQPPTLALFNVDLPHTGPSKRSEAPACRTEPGPWTSEGTVRGCRVEDWQMLIQKRGLERRGLQCWEQRGQVNSEWRALGEASSVCLTALESSGAANPPASALT